MGTQRDSVNFLFPLIAQPGFNDILGKHITTKEKPVIGFERVERLLQRARCGFHRLGFRGR